MSIVVIIPYRLFAEILFKYWKVLLKVHMTRLIPNVTHLSRGVLLQKFFP